MRTLALATAALTLIGCQNAVGDRGLVIVLDPLMTEHAASLAGDDINAMRATGRNLIATYDAATEGAR